MSTSSFSLTSTVSALTSRSGKVSKSAQANSDLLKTLHGSTVARIALTGHGQIAKTARAAFDSHLPTLDSIGTSLDGGSLPTFLALLCAELGVSPSRYDGDKLSEVIARTIDVNIKKIELSEADKGVTSRKQARDLSTLVIAQGDFEAYLNRKQATIDQAQAEQAQAEQDQAEQDQAEQAQAEQDQAEQASQEQTPTT